MPLIRSALLSIASVSLAISLQSCNLFSKSVNPAPSSSAISMLSPMETIEDGTLMKIVKVAIPLPSTITYVETSEKQGDATIVKVTKDGKTKDGYLASTDTDVSKWNADQTMEYYSLTKDRKEYILSVPKFK